MPSSHTVDPTQMDLSHEELSILREGQSAVAHGAGSTSSRAASRASSGLLLLDSSSLAALEVYFNRVMIHIDQQLQYLSSQSAVATQYTFDQSGQMVVDANAEIERFKEVMLQIDKLEEEFDRIGHIREIVSENRRRLEDAERELDRTQPSSAASARRREGHHGSHTSRRSRH